MRITGGEALLEGEDIPLRPKGLRDLAVAYVAQSAAFNPAHKLGDQVIESAVLHGVMSRSEARKATDCSAASTPRIGDRYPHQVLATLQRAMTAMALCSPDDRVRRTHHRA